MSDWQPIETEKPQFGVPIESVHELSSWLNSSGMHGIFMIAQHKTDKDKMHIIIVNGDDDFLAVAGLASMDFIAYVDRRLNADEAPLNRSGQRRARKKRQ